MKTIPKRILSSVSQAYQNKRRQHKPIKVYALVGKSGTGKSFRARLISDARGIEAIIDDGLLIQNGKIIAGESAKQTKNYISAVKTAMFNNPAHRAEVVSALNEAKLTKILLLGTSDRMIHRNCFTLNLPDPSEIIRIEDIASKEEIAAAIHDRKTHGKHIIPLPAIEVKQAYPQLMAQAIKVLLGRARNKTSYDKTIVRPSFQFKGEVTISEAALSQMILHCMREKTPSLTTRKITINREKKGYVIKVRIALPYGTEVANTCLQLHDYVIRQIESFTGITIASLSIHIESVDGTPPEKEH